MSELKSKRLTIVILGEENVNVEITYREYEGEVKTSEGGNLADYAVMLDVGLRQLLRESSKTINLEGIKAIGDKFIESISDSITEIVLRGKGES